MSISSVMSAGMQGIQSGVNRTDSASGRIALGLGDDSSGMANAMVGLKMGEIQVKAAANVVKTGDEMLGTLINIRA